MKSEIKLDVLVMQEKANGESYWVAQCLQHDIVAQAKTLHELKQCLSNVLASHIILSLQKEMKPFVHLPKAPNRYWQLYRKHHSNFESVLDLSLPKRLIPKGLREAVSNYLPRGEAFMRLAETV
jgi:hypothetical protein